MMQASHKNGKIRNSRLPPRAHDRQEGRSIRTLTAECNPDTGQRPSDCLSAPGQTHPEDAQKSPGLREGFIEHAWWWRGKDSNLRRQCRQIYSLIPLTARESLHGTQGADYIRAGELVKHLLHPAQTSRRVAQSPRKPAQPMRRVAQSSRSPAQLLRRPARFSSQPEKISRQPTQMLGSMAQSLERTPHGLEDLAQGSGDISRTSRRVAGNVRRVSYGLRQVDEELRGLTGKSRGCTESSGKSERENKIIQNSHLQERAT